MTFNEKPKTVLEFIERTENECMICLAKENAIAHEMAESFHAAIILLWHNTASIAIKRYWTDCQLHYELGYKMPKSIIQKPIPNLI